jgi:hypothetical protein
MIPSVLSYWVKEPEVLFVSPLTRLETRSYLGRRYEIGVEFTCKVSPVSLLDPLQKHLA